jgi:hypothetical protein
MEVGCPTALPPMLPPTLSFGATSRREDLDGAIRDGIARSPRVGVRFGDARGMVASVRGYLLIGDVGGSWMMATSWDCAWDSSRALAR